MPRDHFPGSPQEWMQRARASLALAKADQVPGILLEDLCYQAQQSAEKALKALYLCLGSPFPFVHSLDQLLAGLEDLGVLVPEDVDQAIVLTRYAVETRYPGVYERVEVEEHQEAIRHAEIVLAWVEIQMNRRGIQTP